MFVFNIYVRVRLWVNWIFLVELVVYLNQNGKSSEAKNKKECVIHTIIQRKPLELCCLFRVYSYN